MMKRFLTEFAYWSLIIAFAAYFVFGMYVFLFEHKEMIYNALDRIKNR